MPSLSSPYAILATVLYVVALHSAAVGLTLMAQPKALLHRTGFDISPEPFFAAQAGVFHLALAAGYAMAAWGLPGTGGLVFFSILVKGMATCFLLLYFLLKKRKWVLLASGMVDGCMGMAIWLAGLHAGL